jgi:pyruvate dehydrogenase E2 component (dihydrolipoamide acetyltransferase)
MPISVVMPALEMAQETGKLVCWLKKDGERIVKGEPLLEVETDKAVMEIEAPGDGVLAGISAQPGMEIPVGKTIAWIVQPGEVVPVEAEQQASGRRISLDAATKRSAPAAEIHVISHDLKVSPKARRLAKERGVDLSRLQGSGPEGEILAADVLSIAGTATPSVPIATDESSSTVARLMAKRVTEAWTTVPHFYVIREVDAAGLKSARERWANSVEQATNTKLTVTDLLVAIVARALAHHPEMNASWLDGHVQYHPEINISVAMAVEGGVVAPVIHQADQLSLGEIAARRRDLSERARSSKLRPSDITGGTFTISNLGMFDVDEFTAIITPPQSAVLAIGRIADRVVAVNGQPAVRLMMTMTLSSDHRVIDGARAALFMRDLVKEIHWSISDSAPVERIFTSSPKRS